MIDARVSTACDRAGTENRAPHVDQPASGKLKSYGKGSLLFASLAVGYKLTLGNHFDDALATAYELSSHFVNGFCHSSNFDICQILRFHSGSVPLPELVHAQLSYSSSLCYRPQNLTRHTGKYP